MQNEAPRKRSVMSSNTGSPSATKDFIRDRVKKYYWRDDINCATANLKILSEIFSVDLSDQVVDAALGMHGAGGYGAQCGLVEGNLMFIGIVGRTRGIAEEIVVDACGEYARRFEKRFKSLLCRELRPEGFHESNPPHLCEALTCEAITFNIGFVTEFLRRHKNPA